MTIEVFSDNLTITNQTRTKIPVIPFVEIKNTILGKNYELSLVFPNKKTATELHEDWKDKSGPANILSFPLEKNVGEIFISLDQAKTECKKFDRAYENYVAFLFIHGCAHLLGHTHGTAMEAFEKKIRAKFKI
jgi:rRNA maturation RNase YbeY